MNLMINTILLLLAIIPQCICKISCHDYEKIIYVSPQVTSSQRSSSNTETIPHQTSENLEQQKSNKKTRYEADRTFKSLSEALTANDLNNTCVVLMKDVTLDQKVHVRNVKNFMLVSSNDEDPNTVNCNMYNNTGIYFYSSSNVVLRDVKFEKCGWEDSGEDSKIEGDGELFGNSASASKETEFKDGKLSAAIGFYNSNNILLQNVNILNSIDYGIVILNSDKVRLNQSSFYWNGAVYMNRKTHRKGGSLYIEHSSNNNCSIKLENAFFSSNDARDGPGGAISLVYRRATGNTFSCNQCTFDGNTAQQGGAVYVLFSKNALTNQISLRNCSMLNNEATKSGGAIHIVHENAKKNLIFLSAMEFSNNKAYLGGCLLSILQSKNSFSTYMNKNTIKSKLWCSNCTFKNCQGMIGSAVYTQGVKSFFENLTVFNSQTRDEDRRKGYGGFYALKSALNFNGTTSFIRNNGSSLVLESSTLDIFDNALFKRNSGYNGGAIALYGHSQIVVSKNAHIDFLKNYAKNKGGAISVTKFVKETIPWMNNQTTDYQVFKCFIEFQETLHKFGKITFHGNAVGKSGYGSDIFIGTLRNCRRENEANLRQTFVTWRNFNFTNKKLNSIVTGATNFTKLVRWRNIHPGKLITPEIQVVDERGNYVQAEVSFNFSSNVRMEQNVALIVGNNLAVNVRLLGKENAQFNATIHTISGRYISKTLHNLKLSACPLGMKLDEHKKGQSKCKCDYAKNRENGIAECIEGDVYLFRNQWVPTKEEPGLKQKGYGCPLGYCKPCNTTNNINRFCNYEKDAPCAKGRDQSSRLCSKCEKHKSATFGGFNNCRDCRGTRGYIWASLFIMFLVSLFVILLVLLKLDIMSYHLGICIYFYQLLYYHYTPQMWSSEDKFHNFLSITVGSIEFSYASDGFPIFCIFDGMNDIEKIAYNNIIPVWMLIFWYILYRCSPYHERYRFSKSNLLHAFTIVGIMVYTDLTKNCINILDFLVIGPHTYPYSYAATLYAQGSHLPYFISAIVIGIFVTIYIPVHFSLFAIKQMKHRVIREPDNTSVEYKLLYFIRKDRYWFLPFFFISRTLTFLSNMLIVNSPSQTTVVTLVTLFNFVVFTHASPYTEAKENWVESILMACLAIIGIANLTLHAVYRDNHAHNLEIAIKIFSTAPLFVVLGSVLWSVVGRKLCFERRQENRINVPVQVPHRLNLDDEPM